jgi:hypothetical protein
MADGRAATALARTCSAGWVRFPYLRLLLSAENEFGKRGGAAFVIETPQVWKSTSPTLRRCMEFGTNWVLR